MSSKRSRNTLFNRFNSTLVAQIIFIAVIAGAMFLFEKFFNEESSVFRNVPKNEAALFIDFNNMKRVFAGEVVDEMTILDALNAAVAAGQIKLIYYVDGDNNTEVKEINDHEANDKEQFTFYINSQKLDSSEINRIHIQPRDKIVIKLE